MFSVMLVRSGLSGVQETCYFVFLKTLTLLASRFTLFCVCFICFVFARSFSFLFVSVFFVFGGAVWKCGQESPRLSRQRLVGCKYVLCRMIACDYDGLDFCRASV